MYTEKQKEKALAIVGQIGITKAMAKTGISYETLRKWRDTRMTATIKRNSPTITPVTRSSESRPLGELMADYAAKELELNRIGLEIKQRL